MEDGAARIDAHFLAKNGLIRSPSVRYKIVGAAADLRPALFEANAFSASAKSTICKCGGEQRVVAMAAAGSGGLTATPPCEDIK
jgi:ribosomal protein L15